MHIKGLQIPGISVACFVALTLCTLQSISICVCYNISKLMFCIATVNIMVQAVERKTVFLLLSYSQCSFMGFGFFCLFLFLFLKCTLSAISFLLVAGSPYSANTVNLCLVFFLMQYYKKIFMLIYNIFLFLRYFVCVINPKIAKDKTPN